MRSAALVFVAVMTPLALVLNVPRPLAQSFSAPAGTVPAPDPNVPLYFEAASVRPSQPGTPGQNIRRQPGGRFSTTNMPVRPLITFAYQIQSYQLIGGPDWLANDRFDIVAKMEGDPPPIIPGTGADHMMLALRTLLADRFKLTIHRETRELDIYALVMARPGGKPGPGLKPAGDECAPEKLAALRAAPSPAATPVCGIQGMPGGIRFGGWPLTLFADHVSGRVGRFVIDRTGLTGNWTFNLTFASEQGKGPGGTDLASDPNAPSLFTAVEEQLGLKLQPTKGPVEVLVIDRVERPSLD